MIYFFTAKRYRQKKCYCDVEDKGKRYVSKLCKIEVYIQIGIGKKKYTIVYYNTKFVDSTIYKTILLSRPLQSRVD